MVELLSNRHRRRCAGGRRADGKWVHSDSSDKEAPPPLSGGCHRLLQPAVLQAAVGVWAGERAAAVMVQAGRQWRRWRRRAGNGSGGAGGQAMAAGRAGRQCRGRGVGRLDLSGASVWDLFARFWVGPNL
jgi:hypothetical protein